MLKLWMRQKEPNEIMKTCYVCKSEDCGCSMDCDPTDHLCCAYGFDKSNCDCEEADTACSNENCKGAEPK
jgi:hypothetical protein